ncbi:MAG: type II toxin-antitoxin system VapC family toxin, partial [Methylococcales bacterium]
VKVFQHILAFPTFTVEDREAVQSAVGHMREGFDFADALHHASYSACTKVITFDTRRFARRAQRKSLLPKVRVPNEPL